MVRTVVALTILSLASVARAQSDRGAPTEGAGGTAAHPVTPIVDGGGLGGTSLGMRLQLTSEARYGVATFVGTRYAAIGHEGRDEIALVAIAEKHLGATLLHADVVYARELEEDQRDAELALSALRAVAARVALGVDGRAVVDLDAGRSDGGEVRWEARGGAAAILRVGGGAALSLHAGAVAIATPDAIRAGPFALAAVGGFF